MRAKSIPVTFRTEPQPLVQQEFRSARRKTGHRTGETGTATSSFQRVPSQEQRLKEIFAEIDPMA
ncbi:MAG: hypothetical protein MZV63_55310 [Marinilabiliales bacterium]|nr:hypothetical protein [Marinilabiliales bacterium]